MNIRPLKLVGASAVLCFAAFSQAETRPAPEWREFKIPGTKYVISSPAPFKPTDATSSLPGLQFQAYAPDPGVVVGVQTATDPSTVFDSPAFCASRMLNTVQKDESFIEGDFLNKTVKGVDSAWICYDLDGADSNLRMTQIAGFIGRADARIIVCLTYDRTSEEAFKTAVKVLESIRVLQ